MTTARNAIGTKLQLVVSASTALLEIEPSGWSRSQSAAPWMMLSVARVAMIDGRRKMRISTALKTPVAIPTPTSASPPGISPHVEVVGVIVYDAVTTHSVISAATDTSKP